MTTGAGLFTEVLENQVDEEEDRLVLSIAIGILLAEPNKKFADWDAEAEMYRAGELGSLVFEIEKPAVDTLFIGTDNRPIALRKLLEAEVENQLIYNCRVDICVIDGSQGEVLEQNIEMLRELANRYEVRFLMLTVDDFFADVHRHTELLYARYHAALDQGNLDQRIATVLTFREVLSDGSIDKEKLYNYLLRNVFFHISGLRNYTVLIGKGAQVIMNVDDDAPAETYVLHRKDREKIRTERLSKREALMQQMREEITQRLQETIQTEQELYAVLASLDKREKIRDIEAQYFGYSPEENTGLIPQAMGEIQTLESQYLDDDGIAHELGVTHHRYQSLMEPLSRRMLRRYELRLV